MVADMDKLREVRDQVERLVVLNPDSQPHAVSIGYAHKNGHETTEPAVIVKVADKISAQNLSADELDRWEQISRIADAAGVRVDVQQQEVPTDRRLYLDDESEVMTAFALPLGLEDHRRRQDKCPLKTGCRIAPKGANWIGTLGAGVQFKDRETGALKTGALTNAHVTGFRSIGTEMLQPDGSCQWFGKVARVVDLKFDRTPNLIDAALIDCFRPADGHYTGANGGTVGTEVIGIGRINPSPVTPALGMKVQKGGQTTAVTTGTIKAVEGTTFVSYGRDGTAYFQQQMDIHGDNGEFSAAGDSGSIILTMDRRPVGLLFAGSTGVTVANYISNVQRWGSVSFY